MTNCIAITGGLLLFALPVAAQAADLVVETPAVEATVSAVDWRGAYLGIHAGLGAGYVYAPGYEDAGTDLDGQLLGLQAGYNVQIDNFVLGIAGDINWSNIGYEIDNAPLIVSSYTAEWLASLRARAGVALDSVLLYGTAGIGAASASFQLDTFALDGSVSVTHVGWVAGVGAEFMVTDGISLGAEYLHYELGAEPYVVDSVPLSDQAIRADTFTIGANFHF